jgi:hypothetical protein
MNPIIAARIFVDFWNFQLCWKVATHGGLTCDWSRMPAVFLGAALEAAAQLGPLTLKDTRVYASVNPDRDGRLRKWMDNVLDRSPGFRVFVRERRSRPKPAHCRACEHDQSACPKCAVNYVHAPEKGVDAALLSDMFSLAWEKRYHVAILVSGDADLVPAVQKIQDKGVKVINATWGRHGNKLARTCWASFPIDSLVGQLAAVSHDARGR